MNPDAGSPFKDLEHKLKVLEDELAAVDLGVEEPTAATADTAATTVTSPSSPAISGPPSSGAPADVTGDDLSPAEEAEEIVWERPSSQPLSGGAEDPSTDPLQSSAEPDPLQSLDEPVGAEAPIVWDEQLVEEDAAASLPEPEAATPWEPEQAQTDAIGHDDQDEQAVAATATAQDTIGETMTSTHNPTSPSTPGRSRDVAAGPKLAAYRDRLDRITQSLNDDFNELLQFRKRLEDATSLLIEDYERLLESLRDDDSSAS